MTHKRALVSPAVWPLSKSRRALERTGESANCLATILGRALVILGDGSTGTISGIAGNADLRARRTLCPPTSPAKLLT